MQAGLGGLGGLGGPGGLGLANPLSGIRGGQLSATGVAKSGGNSQLRSGGVLQQGGAPGDAGGMRAHSGGSLLAAGVLVGVLLLIPSAYTLSTLDALKLDPSQSGSGTAESPSAKPYADSSAYSKLRQTTVGLICVGAAMVAACVAAGAYAVKHETPGKKSYKIGAGALCLFGGLAATAVGGISWAWLNELPEPASDQSKKMLKNSIVINMAFTFTGAVLFTVGVFLLILAERNCQGLPK